MTNDTRIPLLIAFIVFSVLIVAGLVFVITRHENGETDEPGLLSVCWQADGLANFNGESCETPEDLVWPVDRLPLVVRATQGNEASEALLGAAMADINEQVGCVLLTQETDTTIRADVEVSFDVPMVAGSDHPGGSTSFRRDTIRRQRAWIDMYAAPVAGAGQQALTHELLHALGLAHDFWSGSIMRPVQTGQVEILRVTSHDRRLLSEMYCPADRS